MTPTAPNVLAAAALALLSACASTPPPSWHTLMPGALPAIGTPSAAAVAIEVLPVGVPAALDRPQIVVRSGAAGTLSLLEHDRWAAPLGDELRAALGAQLARALGARNVTGLPRPDDAWRLKVELRRFESQPGSHALLDADWSVTRAGGADAPPLLCRSEQRVPTAAAGVDAVVRAHREAVAALVRDIAQAVRSGRC